MRNLIMKKSQVALTGTKKYLYCIGGSNGSALKSCEYLNFNKVIW